MVWWYQLNVLNDVVVPTKYHIQTVNINMNFHEHGMCAGVNTVISQVC